MSLGLFSEADFPDQGRQPLAENAHHLSHQNGGEDGAFPDACQPAQKHEAEDRAHQDTGAVKQGLHGGEGLAQLVGNAAHQTLGGHGGDPYVDIQHQAEADQQNAGSQHGQLAEVSGQTEVTQNVLGAVYKIAENRGENQLEQQGGLKFSAVEKNLQQDIHRVYDGCAGAQGDIQDLADHIGQGTDGGNTQTAVDRQGDAKCQDQKPQTVYAQPGTQLRRLACLHKICLLSINASYKKSFCILHQPMSEVNHWLLGEKAVVSQQKQIPEPDARSRIRFRDLSFVNF